MEINNYLDIHFSSDEEQVLLLYSLHYEVGPTYHIHGFLDNNNHGEEFYNIVINTIFKAEVKNSSNESITLNIVYTDNYRLFDNNLYVHNFLADRNNIETIFDSDITRIDENGFANKNDDIFNKIMSVTNAYDNDVQFVDSQKLDPYPAPESYFADDIALFEEEYNSFIKEREKIRILFKSNNKQ